MTEAEAIDVAREALYVTVIVSAPLLMLALVIGLGVSLFQALTQIQEQTLTFIPKILVLFLSMAFLLPFMMGQMRTLWEGLMDKIIAIGVGG
ncbi:MAG: flagellar biosynthetic protein FliQ [Pseudomonadota bacterium]|jgi:flagellar biosynthetic protein FliQ